MDILSYKLGARGRGATVVIAAANAPTKEKTGADYVCDGSVAFASGSIIEDGTTGVLGGTGSPMDLTAGTTIPIATVGDFIVTLPDGQYGWLTSGNGTYVTGSPLALKPGVNAVTITGAAGNIYCNGAGDEHVINQAILTHTTGGGTFANGTGIATGNATILPGINTYTVTQAGTFTVTFGADYGASSNYYGVAWSGTATVAGSPKTFLIKGANTITVTGTGTFYVSTGMACSIKLTSGQFVLGGSILLPLGHIKLEGVSCEGTILGLSDYANQDMIVINDSAHYCVLENLKLEGNSSKQFSTTKGHGILVNSCYDTEIRSCAVFRCYSYGLYATGQLGLTVYDSYFEFNKKSGIYYRGVQSFFYNIDCFGNVLNGFEFLGKDTSPYASNTQASEVVITASRFEGNTLAGLLITEDTYNHKAQALIVNGCQFGVNKQEGVKCTGAANILFNACVFRDNSQQTDNTYDNFYIGDGASQHSQKISITGSQFVNSAWTKKARYHVYEADANQDYNLIANNIVDAAATGVFYINGAHTMIGNNQGYIAPGEIRTYSGTIATLTENAFNSLDNPFGQAVRVMSLDVYVSTAATATSPNIDCGIGDSATTDYANLFDDLPGETIGFYRSVIATPGAQTVPILWASGSGNRYLNMSIKGAAATGMVASYTVTVMGI